MKYIETLKEGMRISEVYLCKSRQIAQTKAGKDYGNLVLQDKTGTIDSKIWDLGSPGIGSFDVLDYVHVDADVTMFQGNHQLKHRDVRIHMNDVPGKPPAEYPADPQGGRRGVHTGGLSAGEQQRYRGNVFAAAGVCPLGLQSVSEPADGFLFYRG